MVLAAGFASQLVRRWSAGGPFPSRHWMKEVTMGGYSLMFAGVPSRCWFSALRILREKSVACVLQPRGLEGHGANIAL